MSRDADAGADRVGGTEAGDGEPKRRGARRESWTVPVTGDERRRSIEQRAAAVTLHVLSVVLVGGYFVSLVRGRESATWAGLCAVLGATYLLSTIVLIRRG